MSIPKKRLPRHGNVRASGRSFQGDRVSTVLGFGSASSYRVPVNYATKKPYEYNVRKGFENAALPEQGPPGS
jgi:hypothetical protein